MAAPLLSISGRVLPLARQNVDTDLIIPSRYMKTVTRQGLGQGAFAALRGEPDNPFEDPRYSRAPILLAGANFGCGSSREHAVWALQQIGIRAVIAPSFGEIFEANALRNGLLAVRLPEPEVERLLADPPKALSIDVHRQCVVWPDGKRLSFPLDPFLKHCLLNGLDEIGLTSAHEAEIAAYEARTAREQPWLLPTGHGGRNSNEPCPEA